MGVSMAVKELSFILREARREKGYSVISLGKIVGVSQAAISQWENGKHIPGDRQLRWLAEALDLDFEHLRSLAQEERCKKEFSKLKAKYRDKFTSVLLNTAAKELSDSEGFE